MALFEVAINNRGHFVVNAYWLDSYGSYHWQTMKSFGDRQGDARDFMLYDCPKFSDMDIRQYIRIYDPDRLFMREGFKRYKPIR